MGTLALTAAAVLIGFCFVRDRTSGRVYSERTSLAGQTIIVTGANSGIGFEASKELALRGATVVLACRNRDAGASAKRRIDSALNARKRGAERGRVLLEMLDLTDKKSIEKFAENFRNLNFPLNALVLNASIGMHPTRALVNSKLELCFTSNVLGHYYLVELLWDKIVEDHTRIITVTSSLHKYVSLEVDPATLKKRLPDLQCELSYRPKEAYAKSKLANILLAHHWARQLSGISNTRAMSVSMHPGLVMTPLLTRYLPFWKKHLFNLILILLGKTAWKGCQTVIYCCSHPIENGKYYGNCEEEEPSPESRDEDAMQALSESCRELLNAF
ncbi:retinol dehydrogenase 14-like isoform X2 [Schistocerca gregaria]|uniref:retinol dehydrogenase 14-like isoform X2 n=1 Tax=Schistocerca gregaria TaxID=7010 RepID=UPI00211E2386|nr:retinol dehydrogenase 14-like isoform X2 [Schistocerca gregaria]